MRAARRRRAHSRAAARATSPSNATTRVTPASGQTPTTRAGRGRSGADSASTSPSSARPSTARGPGSPSRRRSRESLQSAPDGAPTAASRRPWSVTGAPGTSNHASGMPTATEPRGLDVSTHPSSEVAHPAASSAQSDRTTSGALASQRARPPGRVPGRTLRVASRSTSLAAAVRGSPATPDATARAAGVPRTRRAARAFQRNGPVNDGAPFSTTYPSTRCRGPPRLGRIARSRVERATRRRASSTSAGGDGSRRIAATSPAEALRRWTALVIARRIPTPLAAHRRPPLRAGWG